MKKLEEILLQLVELHEELLTFGREKAEVVKNKDINRFEKITLEEQALVRKIEQAETERLKLFRELFPKETADGATVSLERCIQMIQDSNQKKAIESAGVRLVAVIEELIRCNELNRQLVRDSLNYVNFTLDLVRPPKVQSNNYGASGKQGMPQMMNQTSMFDSQA